MNFLLSPDQREIQETVGRVVANTLGARGLHEVIDGDRAKEAALWRRLAELGIFSLAVDEAHGGQGQGLTDLALVAEVLGHASAPGNHAAHMLVTLAIAEGGSDAQKRRWLPALADGSVTATVALGEAGGAWLPERWTLPAGERLTGGKVHVAEPATPADLIVVGLAGGELGLVETAGGGVSREPSRGVDLTRPIATVHFDGAAAELLPGGRATADRIVDAGLVLIAADAFGCGRRCVEMAVGYSQEREQFGVRIAEFQALRHQLANMALEVEPCRGLFWYAAHAWDRRDAGARHAAALAKSHITDVVLRVGREMIEAHGGIGFTWEFDAHIRLKRAMHDFAWLGTPQQHRYRVADLATWGGPVAGGARAG